MNSIKIIARKSKTILDFSKRYFKYLHEVFLRIDSLAIKNLLREFDQLRKDKSTLFIIGNGGGASTASAMANDLGFDILKKTSTKNPFKIISLAENNSVLTAISNDTGYENVFLNQLKLHFRKKDKLLILSASGNSKNLLKAAKFVKKKKGKIIGILGFDGGVLKDLCDICVHIQTEVGDYGPVEDIQLIINHIIAHWYQEKIKK